MSQKEKREAEKREREESKLASERETTGRQCDVTLYDGVVTARERAARDAQTLQR